MLFCAIFLYIVCSSYAYAVVVTIVGPLQIALSLLPAIAAGLIILLFVLWGLGICSLKQALTGAAATIVLFGIFLYWAEYIYPCKKSRPVFTSSNKASKQEKTTVGWPMFRGGTARRGSLPGSKNPTNGDPVWTFDQEDKTFFASPAVVGNRIYITSCNIGVFKDSGAIYCVDADTGDIVWKYVPDNFRATFSSPAVSGRYLVCGEGLHSTEDARLICLDISDEKNVRLLWEYRTISHVESSPCIYRDKVYAGAGEDGYYCLKLEPDAKGNPVMVWHAGGETYPDAETSPSAKGGKVYVGIGIGGKAVCCLDAETGREIWRTKTPYPVYSPPTVAEGKVFVGMGNGNLIQSAEEIKAGEIEKLKKKGTSDAKIAEAVKNLEPGGEVWCLDAETGDVEFKFKADRAVLGAVAAGEDRLYFGSRDGRLYCISYKGLYKGKKICTWKGHHPIVTSPALTRTHVYFITGQGTLYACTADTLSHVWDTSVGRGSFFISSPAVVRGHVYVGTDGTGLRCLGTK